MYDKIQQKPEATSFPKYMEIVSQVAGTISKECAGAAKCGWKPPRLTSQHQYNVGDKRSDLEKDWDEILLA